MTQTDTTFGGHLLLPHFHMQRRAGFYNLAPLCGATEGRMTRKGLSWRSDTDRKSSHLLPKSTLIFLQPQTRREKEMRGNGGGWEDEREDGECSTALFSLYETGGANRRTAIGEFDAEIWVFKLFLKRRTVSFLLLTMSLRLSTLRLQTAGKLHWERTGRRREPHAKKTSG